MRAELISLNHCAVSFLSRAVVNFCYITPIYAIVLYFCAKDTPSTEQWSSGVTVVNFNRCDDIFMIDSLAQGDLHHPIHLNNME